MIRVRTERPIEKKALGFWLAALLAMMLLAAKPAHADATFTVNDVSDGSDVDINDDFCDADPGLFVFRCTLRAAIEEANATAGADTINFNIPGSGVKTISPASALPEITDTVTINGYSQPGASPNTRKRGNDANLLIELNGSRAGTGSSGLKIEASNSVVRGLVINRFGDAGILIVGGTANKVEGNFIGTDATGTQDLGNSGNGMLIYSISNTVTVGGTSPDKRNLISGNDASGVFIDSGETGNEVMGNYIGTNANGSEALGNRFSGVVIGVGSDNTIGGTSSAARNLISGNGTHGVFINFIATDNEVLGNFIGTDKDGTGDLGNGLDGVLIDGDSNTVGGAISGAANTIAFNGQSGVAVFSGSSTGNRILSNSIFSNDLLGIDLGGDGPTTPNDLGDRDTGPNNLQNFPVLISAKTSRKGTTIKGALNSTPEKTFLIQLFSNPEADPFGHGEGKKFIGQKKVTTNVIGDATFTFKKKKKIPKGQFITATATSSDGDTSEFSVPREVVQG